MSKDHRKRGSRSRRRGRRKKRLVTLADVARLYTEAGMKVYEVLRHGKVEALTIAHPETENFRWAHVFLQDQFDPEPSRIEGFTGCETDDSSAADWNGRSFDPVDGRADVVAWLSEAERVTVSDSFDFAQWMLDTPPMYRPMMTSLAGLIPRLVEAQSRLARVEERTAGGAVGRREQAQVRAAQAARDGWLDRIASSLRPTWSGAELVEVMRFIAGKLGLPATALASAAEAARAEDEDEHELSEREADEARETMRDWFLEHFKDPADGVPWAEGQYYFVNGGPYDPWQVLIENFESEYPLSLIESVAAELASSGGDEWVRQEDY